MKHHIMFISEHAFIPDVSRSVFIGMLIKPKNIFLRPFFQTHYQSFTLTLREDTAMIEVSCFSPVPTETLLVDKAELHDAFKNNCNIQLYMKNSGHRINLPYSVFQWLFNSRHEGSQHPNRFGEGERFSIVVDDDLEIAMNIDQIDYFKHGKANDLSQLKSFQLT